MSRLCSLPLELIFHTISHLASFDRNALSKVSKHLYAIISAMESPIKPSDEIFRHIFLCLNPPRSSPTTNPFLNQAVEVRELLARSFHHFLREQDLHYGKLFDERRRLLGYTSRGPPRTLSQHELLEPYLPNESFPRSTIAWYYFATVEAFATEACKYLLGDFERLIQWANIGNDARRWLGWLEPQQPYRIISIFARPEDLADRPPPSQAADMALIRHPRADVFRQMGCAAEGAEWQRAGNR